jgi:hypothetical protein
MTAKQSGVRFVNRCERGKRRPTDLADRSIAKCGRKYNSVTLWPTSRHEQMHPAGTRRSGRLWALDQLTKPSLHGHATEQNENTQGEKERKCARLWVTQLRNVLGAVHWSAENYKRQVSEGRRRDASAVGYGSLGRAKPPQVPRRVRLLGLRGRPRVPAIQPPSQVPRSRQQALARFQPGGGGTPYSAWCSPKRLWSDQHGW